MHRCLVPFLALALTACPNPTPQVDPITPVVATPVATPVPTPMPTPFVCTGWQDQLRVNDFASARTIFDNCLLQDDTDTVARMGRGLTGMFLLYDSPPVREVLTTCGESPELYGPIFGPDGSLAANTAAVQGSATLTAERVIDGVATASSFLESVDYVWTDNGGRYINVADTFVQHENLTLNLNNGDTLSQGDVLTITGDGPDTYVSVPCDLDPTACTDDFPSEPSGTVTIVEVPSQNGNFVFDLDIQAPMNCDGCTSSTMHITGRITDTENDFEPVARAFPFVDALENSRCATTEHCDYRTSFITALADVCPAGTAQIGVTNAHLMRDLFVSFAEDFEAVAADPAFAMTYPAGGFFFVEDDLQVNQTDALALAGLARGMAASITLGTSYNLIDPATTFGSRGVTYTANDWDGDTCGTDDYWGVSVAAMATELDTHLGAVRTDADFAGAREQLLNAFLDFSAATAATPEATGMLDFSQSATWSQTLKSDLDAVVASLQGTDGALPTAPAYAVTLDAFFADPTDRTDLLTSLAVTELVSTAPDDNACETEFAFAPTGRWWSEETGSFAVSETTIDDGVLPSWIDESVLDADDVPLWASQSIRTLNEAYSYVP